jgi:hypothetical protein
MTMSEHPDAEGLSAYFDREAPELAAHVAGCEACRAEVARLKAVSASVGAPVPQLDPGAVDAMIGEAVAVREGTPVHELSTRRTRRDTGRWVAVASIAAALVLAIGLAGVLTRGDGQRNTETESASRPAAAPTSGATNLLAPSEVTGSDDTAIDGGDLGDIADSGQLASRAGPRLAAESASAGDNPVVEPSAAADSGPAPRSRAVGTRACELQARTIDPSVGAVVYVAHATQDGTPATVLGFSSPAGGRPISLFLMAQDGCRLLATATVP